MRHREVLIEIVEMIRAGYLPRYLLTLYVLWLNDGMEPNLVRCVALRYVITLRQIRNARK